MATLPPNLFTAVHGILWPRLQNESDRRSLLAPLFSGREDVYKRIDWAGDADAFTSRLILQLAAPDLADALASVAVGHEQQETVQRTRQLVMESVKVPADTADPLAVYRQRLQTELSADRYRIDTRFVELTLLIDQGNQAQGTRFVEDERRTGFSDLREVLALDGIKRHAAIVLLGRPGSGKSTLLRRLQFDTVLGGASAPFFVSLNRYGGDPAPDPMAWLAEEWRKTAPGVTPLERLLTDGQTLLLLDALNEMPHRDAKDYAARIALWQRFLGDLPVKNQVVFSCRSLDYSAPLSSESDGITVQQVTIKPMGPDQIGSFLAAYLPGKDKPVWDKLKNDAKLLDLYSTPYFLRLLTEQAGSGNIPRGRAELFTGFARRALKREIENKHRLLQPGELLSRADHLQITQDKWATPYALPERGCLIPLLSALSYAMQRRGAPGEGGRVRISVSDAIQMLDHPRAEDILEAGCELSIIDRDIARDEVLFFHQLLQEYFAARVLAAKPEPELARSEWRADHVSEALADTVARLQDYEPLPPLPATGWEESAVIATAMARDPDAFARGLMEANLPLAGRCAADPGATVDEPTRNDIRFALIARTRDLSADLRARIAAGLALGELGDPRLVLSEGKPDMYLMPPLVRIEGGRYTLGDKDSSSADERFQHPVDLAVFQIGQFPVTNAEYRRFINARGYDDERWWGTEAAKRWRRGEGAAEGQRQNWRETRDTLRTSWTDDEINDLVTQKRWTSKQAKDYVTIRNWSDADFEAWLDETIPLTTDRYTTPRYWDDPNYNAAAQPVVGVCWHEARAYCAWLAAQSGRPFRLPTEAEREAAARGKRARSYPYGKDFVASACNTFESHIRRTTPIGIFPSGETPPDVNGLGASDLSGNVYDWTSSAYLDYPYVVTQDREDPNAAPKYRAVRGGSWFDVQGGARAAYRGWGHPGYRSLDFGFRVVCGVAPVWAATAA